MKKKIAIITTHPIQYNAPLFSLLSKRGRIDIKVFYTWSQSNEGMLYDPGFGKKREWDIPLFEAYEFEFIKNTSKKPGSDHFRGIINPDLIKKIKEYSPDAILVYGWKFYSHLKVLIYFKKKTPIYFRGDSTTLDDDKLPFFKKSLRNVFLRCLYHFVDKALYVGQLNKNYFLNNGLKEHQLFYAPHCVDNLRFWENSDFYDKEALISRRQHNIPDNSVAILFAGKLEEKKDPGILIDVFRQISNENLRLIIVGNGVLEDQLKQQSKNDSRIIFIDFQNQSRMPIIYRMGDIFILPSKGPGETWGLSVNESMASGRPAIVSNKVGCHLDLIKHGVTGFVFESSKPEGLTKIINELPSKEILNEMGLLAKLKIQEFNYEKICTQIELIVNA